MIRRPGVESAEQSRVTGGQGSRQMCGVVTVGAGSPWLGQEGRKVIRRRGGQLAAGPDVHRWQVRL